MCLDLFGLFWVNLEPKCWNYTEKCNGLERNLNGLERTIYVPILTVLPVYLIKKIGVMVLKEIQDPLLLPCVGCIKQRWLNMQVIWPNWLPMVGHTLAMTHIYNLKYTSLRTYWLTNRSCVCPWSSAWSLTLLSLELNQLYARRSCLGAPTLLGNDATVNMGRSLAFLFSFSLTSLSLLVPWEEQVQCCHHVSCTNKQYGVCIAWHVGKAIYCCAHAVQ